MYFVILLFFVSEAVGGLVPDTNAGFGRKLVHDCAARGEKEFELSIWNLLVESVSVRNCDSLLINIEKSKFAENLTEISVNNVGRCRITGRNLSEETELPRRSVFRNISSLTVEVPVFGKKGKWILLEFSNLTIENLPENSIKLLESSSYIEVLSMNRVNVTNASSHAISVFGDSLVIQNCHFNAVSENFLSVNASDVIITNSSFRSPSSGSFNLNTGNFNFTGNNAGLKPGHVFNISARSAKFGGNTFEFLRREENDARSNNIEPTAEEVNGISKNKMAIFSVCNRILLLWFVTLTGLVILFPVAFCIKVYACILLDKYFPKINRHELLVNAQEISYGLGR